MKLPSGVSTTTYPKEPDRKVIHSWNVIVQRELTSWLTAQVGYVGTRAIGQMGFININTAAPGTGNAGRALAAFGLTQDINMIKPFGDMNYNGLQAEVRARLNSAQFGAAYTLSKTTNYADNDANPRIPYPPAKELNKAVAGYDRTHNFQGYWVWDLPFGKGRRWSTGGVAGAVFGGWQVNGLVTIQTGQPINVVQGTAGNLLAQGQRAVPRQGQGHRGDLSRQPEGKPPPREPIAAPISYFDTSAFAAVSIPAGQQQRFGNVGPEPHPGAGFLERRPRPLPDVQRGREPQAAAPGRGAERTQPPQLRPTRRRRLQRAAPSGSSRRRRGSASATSASGRACPSRGNESSPVRGRRFSRSVGPSSLGPAVTGADARSGYNCCLSPGSTKCE